MYNTNLDLFDKAFEALVTLNSAVRQSNSTIDITSLSPFELIRDFATVSFDPGQRTGKTTWIATRATNQDIVVVKSKMLKQCFPNTDAKVLTLKGVKKALERHKNILDGRRFVFIEQSKWIGREELAVIYAAFCGKRTTFILV